MAKESMKAREVKRARMAAKYADKRAKYLAEGNYEALQTIPKNASPFVSTIDATLRDVQKDICVSLDYRAFSLGKWLRKVSYRV